MKASPFFSVVIPTLNEENFVPRLLRDLSRQVNKDFEVIVIDGSSEDNTCLKVKNFSKLFPLKLSVVDKPNVSKQRNIGASKAKGKYLVFLDADSRIKPGFLKKLKKIVSKTPYLAMIPRTVPEKRTYDALIFFNLLNLAIEISQYIGKHSFATSGSLIFDRNFFFHIGQFDEKLYIAEDHEIIKRCHQVGVTAQYLKDVSLSWSMRRYYNEGRLKLITKYAIATAHYIKDGAIYDRVIEYEMGGRQYRITKKSNGTVLNKTFKKHLNMLSQFKSYLEKVTAE